MGAAPEQARLVLDNVDSPVVASVAHRNEERLKVKHALPFLQLETGVRDEQGRRAVIRGVELALEAGTPNLLLDLEYVDVSEKSTSTLAMDDTMPAIHIAPGMPIRRDSTLPLGLTGRAVAKPLVSPSFDVLELKQTMRKGAEPSVEVASAKPRSARRDSTVMLRTPGRDWTESFEIEVDLSALEDETVHFDGEERSSTGAQTEDECSFTSRARALATALLNVVR